MRDPAKAATSKDRARTPPEGPDDSANFNVFCAYPFRTEELRNSREIEGYLATPCRTDLRTQSRNFAYGTTRYGLQFE